jgi:hypothetical protein
MFYNQQKTSCFMGAFQIVALNNPDGIIRSVENTNGVPALAFRRDASLRVECQN